MATYTVSAGHRGTGLITMVASQVDSVVFTDNVSYVQVINPGSNTVDIWATGDGSTPSVPAAGASTAALRVLPGMALDLELRGQVDTVKIVSSGTPAGVSVQVRDA